MVTASTTEPEVRVAFATVAATSPTGLVNVLRGAAGVAAPELAMVFAHYGGSIDHETGRPGFRLRRDGSAG